MKTAATPDLLTFASNPALWIYRRMTARPKVVETLNVPVPRTPQSEGVAVVDFIPPPNYAFARPARAERDSRHPEFIRYDARSVVCSNDGTADAWLDQGLRGYESVQQIADQYIRTAETGQWKKLTIQVGSNVSYFAKAMGPGHRTTALPLRFLAILEHVADVYKRYRGPQDSSPDPAETNAGAPTYVKGPAAKVVSAAVFGLAPDLDRIIEFSHSYANAIGLPSSIIHSYGVSKRSGPVYKALPQNKYVSGNDWETIATASGTEQRNRPVQMAPAGANRLLRPLYGALNSARRRIPGLWHKGGPDAKPFAAYAYHYESDISGYDTSVSPELQDAIRFAWARAFPELVQVISFWRYMENRPLLTPHWGLTDGLGSIVQSRGGIHSGLKMTSEFGTFLNIAATLYALEKCGIMKATAWPEDNRHATLYIFGDDARVSTSREADPETWAAAFDELGLRCEIAPGGVFLSRYTLPELFDAPLAGRIVQQTMSHEKENVNPETALGIAYLGFIARTQGIEKLPLELQKTTWSVLTEAEWIRALPKQGSATELSNYLRTSSSAQEIIGEALANAATTEWYVDKVRSAEHSPTAYAEMMMADAAFANLGAKTKTLDAVTDAIASHVANLPFEKRLELAISGFYAVGEGSKAAAQWLQTAASSYVDIELLLNADTLNDGKGSHASI